MKTTFIILIICISTSLQANTQSGKWYVVASNSCGSLGASIDIEVGDPINFTLTTNSTTGNYCLGALVDLDAQINSGSGNYFWAAPSHLSTTNNHLSFTRGIKNM